MNLSDSNQIVNFYEQMLMQRNLAVKHHLQQNDPLHLQILNKSGSSNSSASSTSSLLSISSKSQQASPNNSLVSDKSESPDSKPKINEYETNYQTYMINAAAAAAAAFPYTLFNNFNASTPILTNPKSLIQQQQPKQNFHYQNNQLPQNKPQAPTQPAHHHHHHYHHSNQNIYRPNGKSEEAKPTHSYIGLIALAILSTPEKKLVLSDIYQWILDNYTYFHTRGSGWRNSIRHNLSLNDCFMKSGRSSNGKGHYWTIHPANMEDFMKGDFRRRRAQRRVRKSLGLTVPEEDEEDDDILTPPSSLSPVQQKYKNLPINNQMCNQITNSAFFYDKNKFNFYNFQSNFCAIKRSYSENEEKECTAKRAKHLENENISEIESVSEEVSEGDEADNLKANNSFIETKAVKKRSFNVDSLLAPDCETSPKKIKTDLAETDFDFELNSSSESNKSTRLLNDSIDLDSKLNKTNKKSIDDLHPNPKLDSTNDDVEQWKQTFSKIMARSYKNNATQPNHPIGSLIKK